MATTEQIVREAPEIEARKLGLLDTAKSLADKPLTLPEQQIAGLTPEQLQAIQLGQQGIGGYQPFLTSALQSQAAGLGTCRLVSVPVPLPAMAPVPMPHRSAQVPSLAGRHRPPTSPSRALSRASPLPSRRASWAPLCKHRGG